ncbi:MAG: CpsD/CapB family tyrosine-protein kinase [Lysobacter sp.]|nr:CpsD/CapB family tyrosine-protein kinase [Lysobacter sp.]
MTRHDTQETPVSPDQDSPDCIATPSEAALSIARFKEPQAFSPRKLEESRLIHRNDSVREQADSFRELRTRLLALGGDRSFITLVAPIAHGCGGSFVARNLAAAFAFDDSKTSLLIDCDAHHPAQHTALGVDATEGGLMDYLDDPSVDLAGILYPTAVPRLRLIPGGRPREITGERFISFRMRGLVDSLRGRYDDRYLILDGPSVEGSPDARILSDLADFVVLVAGYGRVTLEAVDKAVATFPPEKLAGVVFNNAP